MPATPTYSTLPHAPATARTQLATTRRYSRYAETHPLPPLKGHRKPRTAAVSYRDLSPYGESLPFGAKGNPSESPIFYSSFCIHHSSLSYTFSAKERDSETGLSCFGSRYYSSDLSIWLSVDPQSDKYASLSPYVYCADNPVKLVDPNGEDWFENELTGDVYYSKYLSKGDNPPISGEGWKWMGKDDMFGSSPTQLILVDHFDKSTFVNCDQKGVETALFEGKNANKIHE